jgi:uncharacterized membrane protein
MSHLQSVQKTAENRFHWVAKAPAGARIEWDAEVINERPNELIAWRSLEGSEVDNAGSVRFEPAPGHRGTIVKVEMKYNPPGGVIGAGFAKLLGQSPDKQIRLDLLRLKQVLETGEIATTEGQPAGAGQSAPSTSDKLVRS